MVRLSRWMTAAALVLAPLGWTDSASAYCLSNVCEGGSNGTRCEPAQPTDCGGPSLRWPRGCVGFGVQMDGSVQVSAAKVQELARQAFASWEGADCGDGRTPNIHIEDFGRVDCEDVQYNKVAGNTNVIVFRDKRWPHAATEHAVALTTTTYDPDTGALLDADIELNSENFRLSTTDTTSDYDLLSVLTHESGHFLGIGHSEEADATMFAVYQPGGIELRTLTADDVAAICTNYPPSDDKDVDCNPLPKHGFSPYCAGEQPEGDCAVRSGPREPDEDGRFSPFGLMLLLTAGVLAGWRRRGHRPLG